MEIRFKQTSVGWCTVYTWANLLNDNSILKFCDDERFKGCGPVEEDEILLASHPTIKLATVIGVDATYKIPLSVDYVWDLIQLDDEVKFCDNQVIFYCLSVRLIESMFHHVAIVKHNSGFYYCDPRRDKWLKIESAEQFSRQFKDIWTVQRPAMREANVYASFDGNMLNLPFMEKELA